MSNLNKQLNEITDTSIRLIASRLDQNKGVIIIANPDEVMQYQDSDDISPEFMDKSLMLTHTFEIQGNEDVYLLRISGNEIDCKLSVITEFGSMYIISLFELDAHNLTLLADFILNKTETKQLKTLTS